MKKSTKFIIALLVTVGALAITYRVVNQAPSKSLPLTLRCKRSLLPVAACNAIRVVRIFLFMQTGLLPAEWFRRTWNKVIAL